MRTSPRSLLASGLALATLSLLPFPSLLAEDAATSTAPTCSATEQLYRGSMWQCHDGTYGNLTDSCMQPSAAEAAAQKACDGRCNKETGKCGVNSYTLGKPCEKCASKPASTCPTEEKLRSMSEYCTGKGGKAERVQRGECTWLECALTAANRTACPSSEKLDAMAKMCAEKGGSASKEEYDGCTRIKCVRPEGDKMIPPSAVQPEKSPGVVLCKKITENACTMIRCEDGFSWNSCSSMVKPGSAMMAKPMEKPMMEKMRPKTEKKTTTDTPSMTRGSSCTVTRDASKPNCWIKKCRNGEVQRTCK